MNTALWNLYHSTAYVVFNIVVSIMRGIMTKVWQHLWCCADLRHHLGVDAEQVGIYQRSPVFRHLIPLLNMQALLDTTHVTP